MKEPAGGVEENQALPSGPDPETFPTIAHYRPDRRLCAVVVAKRRVRFVETVGFMTVARQPDAGADQKVSVTIVVEHVDRAVGKR